MDPLVIGVGALVALYLLGGSKKTTTSPTKPASTIPPFPYTPPPPAAKMPPATPPTTTPPGAKINAIQDFNLVGPGGWEKSLGHEDTAKNSATIQQAQNYANERVLQGQGKNDGDYILSQSQFLEKSDPNAKWTNLGWKVIWEKNIAFTSQGGVVKAHYVLDGPNKFLTDLGSAESSPTMDENMKGVSLVSSDANVLAGQGKNDGYYQLHRDGTMIWGKSITYASLMKPAAVTKKNVHYILSGPGGFQQNLGTAESPTMDENMKGVALISSNANALSGQGKKDGVYSLTVLAITSDVKADTHVIWSKTITYADLIGAKS